MNWHDLENPSSRHLADFIPFASLAGVEGVFQTPGKGDDLHGVGAPAPDAGDSSVNASHSRTLPATRVVFAREGPQWQNTLPIDVDVDLEYVQLGFVENRGRGEKTQEQVSVLRFDGPFAMGEHPLVLSLTRRQVSLMLTLVARGSGKTTVKVLDVIGVDDSDGR